MPRAANRRDPGTRKYRDDDEDRRHGLLAAARPNLTGRREQVITAVILAAGRGSRLAWETRDRPKCLVEVGGVPLLEHQLHTLASAGINDVCIVLGYMADAVRDVVGGRAQYVYSREWARTNSLYSLSLCSECICTQMLVMNCDVLAHPEAIYRVLRSQGSAFALDSSSGSDQEHMKVELSDGFLASMGKDLPCERTHGENVGILYFEAHATRVLFREAATLLRAGGRDQWMAAAVERTARSTPLRGVDVADLPWIEIDCPQDLRRARQEVLPKMLSGTEVATHERLQRRSRRDVLPLCAVGARSE